MDSSIWIALGGVVASAVSAYFAYRASTKATDRTADLTEQANQLQWVKELRADAADARREASGARQEATRCHLEMESVRREATALADELHRIVRSIHDPYMTIDRLRAIYRDPGPNGTSLRRPVPQE